MYKQGTVKDAFNCDRTNEAMVEYVGVSLGPVTSRAQDPDKASEQNRGEAQEEVPVCGDGGSCRGTPGRDESIKQIEPRQQQERSSGGRGGLAPHNEHVHEKLR